MCGVGGSGIPVEVLRRFEELYGTELVYEGYGLTETSPVTHFNTPDRGRRVGSIGRPVEGVSAKIVDDEFDEVAPVEESPVDADLDEITGKLVVSGPNVMKGYAGLPDANEDAFTQEGGKRWFHTGDLGYHDADGFYVVDREDHTINTAGYDVYPREVEFVEELPRTTTGKVQKFELQGEWAWWLPFSRSSAGPRARRPRGVSHAAFRGRSRRRR